MRQKVKNSLVRELQEIFRGNEGKDICMRHSECTQECPGRKVGDINIGGWGVHLSDMGDEVQYVEEFFSDFGEFPMRARRIARTGKKRIRISMQGSTNEKRDSLLEEFKKISHNKGFNIESFEKIPRTSSTDGYSGGSYGPAFELIIGW